MMPASGNPESLAIRLALARIEELEEANEAFRDAACEPIAVVSMSCRFPQQANDPESFWQLLREGRDAVCEIPIERWNIDDWYDPNPDVPGKMYTRQGAFLDQIDQFDPAFFGISPREAAYMDPQQRLLLEVAWEALERAGWVVNSDALAKTGVFVGSMWSEYVHLGMNSPDDLNAYVGTGAGGSFLAGRLSYHLGLRGPSLPVETACSSSLVAVHLACQSLRRGECDRALAGGVNVMILPESTVLTCKLRALSPDGRCKTFDASADGYGRGEGCGLVTLRRLSDAHRDGDPILAVIRGSAFNHNGSSGGLTVPNAQAQREVIQAALRNAQVTPREISYVEAHGTGTSLGDPIEVRALWSVLKEGRLPEQQPLIIASVKTNIGHLEGAAGIAGLIKVILCLQHGEIPAQLHLKELNPLIAAEKLPLRIPQQRQRWATEAGKSRLAGISSFGLSGSNCHLIVGEAPQKQSNSAEHQTQPMAALARPQDLLVLSAKMPAALRELAVRYRQWLEQHPEADLADVCFTAGVGRSHLEHRAALVASSPARAAALLKTLEAGGTAAGLYRGQSRPGVRIAWLFSGAAGLYRGMARELSRTQPTFRASLEASAAVLAGELEYPLGELLGRSDLAVRPEWSEPALVAVQLGLAELWRGWGITPDVLLGQGVGQMAAACAAGVLSAEAALRLAARRGRLTSRWAAGGGLTAVFAPASQVQGLLAGHGGLSLAADHGGHGVLRGPLADLQALEAELTASGLGWRRLGGTAGCPPESERQAFASFAASFAHEPAQRTLVCPLSGFALDAAGVVDAGYWGRHWSEPLALVGAAGTLAELGCEVLLEVGPRPVLVGLAAGCWPAGAPAPTSLASLRQGHPDAAVLGEALARLYVAGVTPDFGGLDRPWPRQKLDLPTYPFQRQRYWLDVRPRPFAPSQPLRPLRGDKHELASWEVVSSRHSNALQRDRPEDWLYEVRWRSQPLSAAVDLQEGRQQGVVPARGQALAEEPGTWLVLADRGGRASELAEALQRRQQSCALVEAGADFMALGEGNFRLPPQDTQAWQRLLKDLPAQPPLRGIVHLASLDCQGDPADAATLLRQVEHSCGSVLALVQALLLQDRSPAAGLWLVTEGAQSAEGGSLPALAQVPLWGLGRTLVLEHPELQSTCVDLDPDRADQAINSLVAELLGGEDEDQIVFRGTERLVARLVPATLSDLDKVPAIRDDATYLLTGGAGGIGLKVAEWLIRSGAKNLAMIGRRQPTEEGQGVFQELTAQGAHIAFFQGDVSEKQSLAVVLERIEQTMPRLAGCFHLAGVTRDGLLEQQQWEDWAAVMAPKVLGAWNLHQLTEHAALDFFVLFSSAAAVLGSPGGANYAAANACLDGLAHLRQRMGLPAVSIDWGMWAETGMAANPKLQLQRLAFGIRTISPESNLRILELALAGKTAVLGVLPIDWDRFLSHLPGRRAKHLFSDLDVSQSEASRQFTEGLEDLKLVERIRVAKNADKVTLLRTLLQRQFTRTLGTTPEQTPVDKSLFNLGLDSLMLMEVLRRLTVQLQITIYPREVYEHPTLSGLATYLSGELDHQPVELNKPLQSAPEEELVFSQHTGSPRRAVRRRVPNVVLLLSAPRSGSTLLRVMLAGHPNLFVPPELHLLPFEGMAERQQKLGPMYLTEGLERAWMELRGCDLEACRQELNPMIERDADVLEVYQQIHELAEQRLIIDKSPSYAASLERLLCAEDWFDRPRYIWLIRHPYSMIESFVRMRMGKLFGSAATRDQHQLAEQVWNTMNGNLKQFRQKVDPSRCHFLRFEDLVANPEPHMRELCRFLGVAFHSAVLQPYEGKRMTDGVTPQSTPIDDVNFLKRREIETSLGDAWRDIRFQRPMSAETARLCEELGYELGEHKNDGASITCREAMVRVGDLQLCVCTWGPAGGLPLLLLHGLLDQAAIWEPVAKRLAAQGFRILAPDLRGHGRSDHVGLGGSYHLMDFVLDIDRLLQSLDLGAVHVAGHSMGAVIATLLAAARPEHVRQLTVIEPPVTGSSKKGKRSNKIGTLLDHMNKNSEHPILSSVAEAANQLSQAIPGLAMEHALRLAERATVPVEQGFRWRWDARLRTRSGLLADDLLGDLSLPDLLSQLNANIMLIHGSTTWTNREAQLQDLANTVSHSYELIGGHHLAVEASDALADLLLQAAATGSLGNGKNPAGPKAVNVRDAHP